MTRTEALKYWQIQGTHLFHLHGDPVWKNCISQVCGWDPTNELWFCSMCNQYAPPEIQFTGRLTGVRKMRYGDVTGSSGAK